MDEKEKYHAESVKELCRNVELAANLRVSTRGHFEILSECIFRRIGILLSPTTLKRIWGYLDEPVKPRISTLDALSRFCGWEDYERFLSGHRPDIESGNVGSSVIRGGEDILRGERVRLFWNPSRVCEIEYLGNLEWEVVESEGTRLRPGDRFRCPMIVSGEPLYLDNLTKNGIPAGIYVCGSRSGVTFRIENRDKKD